MAHVKICVVGAGVIGLSSAVRIQDAFPNIDITILADTFSPYTTSDGSAGFWEPHLLNPEQNDDLSKWGKETFEHIMGLVRSDIGGQLGAQLVSGFNFSNEATRQEVPWKDQVIAFRQLDNKEREIHPKQRPGVFYTTVMIDVKSYLPWLMEKFRFRGGKVRHRKISSLNEISEYDVIVNCTGIGANSLMDDEDVKSIRGQIIRVFAPWIKHFYIDLDEEENTERYIIPGRDYVTLGGTSQEGNWSTDVSEYDQKRIWDECVNLIPSLKNAQKVADWVGLRPNRTKVRLEEEKRGKSIVIHNYGHSGAGVTLHWGCAGEVVTFLKNSMTLSSRL